ncbi:hypothetical protein [Shinella pollutisoli]|uniref:Uncharacterized protein n=1 Tax=Shinella pollutisoli TaxID=2250594 RepID=A0ABV7DFD7_9HYPH|nr:hypothetical protein [Shinella pollutisoli]
MVDAVSLSGNGFGVAGPRPAAETRPAAVPAPTPAAAPVPQADAADVGDLDFLYGPSGEPQGSGRLAMTSDTLTAFLTSLMRPAADAGEAAQAGEAAPAAAGRSVVAQLYGQF